MSTRHALSIVLLLTLSFTSGGALAADDIPGDLVVDMRVFEARSTTPDFKAMQELAFFINTDGVGVTEPQWLATIARQAPDSFLATLAFETFALSAPVAQIEIEKRSRKLTLSVDLSQFMDEGIFLAGVDGELSRRDEAERSFQQTVELRLGQTHAFSGPGLELSPSEYLSHFRDYSDGDHRRGLYDKLRDYTTFLIVALSLRRSPETPDTAPVTMSVPDDIDIPVYEGALGVELIGTVDLELSIDESGAPTDVLIRRSSIPELNSRILGEVENWRFPDAAGQRGRLSLELEASP